MSLVEFYLPLRWVHISCVIASGILFGCRGVLMWIGSGNANHFVLRRLSYIIDTVLLTAAILLTLALHQYPWVQGWLTMKVLLLIAYIVLGSLALKRGSTLCVRRISLVAAIAVYLFIASVAWWRDPLGALRWL